MASGPIKSRQILTDLDLRNNTIYDANIPYKLHYYEYETSLDNISGAKEGDIAKIEETDKTTYYKYHNGAWVLIQDPDTELSETSTNTVQNQAITKVILDNEKVVAAMGNDLNDRILNIDNEISTNITNEITRAKAAEKTNSDAITTETTRATTAETTNANNITTLQNDLKNKQNILVSGTNIKTINGNSILGNGDITISGSGDIDLSNYALKTYVDTQDATKVDKVTGKSLISDTEITRLASVTNYDDSTIKTSISNKVDKVTGKSLISDSEIIRLANVSNYDDSTITKSITDETSARKTADTTLQTNIDTKVDKVTGKSLISDTEITRLASIKNYDDTTITTNITNEITRAKAAEETKVDKVAGKSLISDTEITRLANVTYYDDTAIKASVENKVDKVTGKGLSTNDFTTELLTKLQGLSNYDDTAAIARILALENWKDALTGTTADDVINSFKEIEDFLSSITGAQTLTQMLAQMKSDILASLATETSERKAADTTLQSNIDKKVDKVSGKSLISDTEITRLAGISNYDDSTITDNLNSEIARANAADTANATAIAAETTRAEAAEKANADNITALQTTVNTAATNANTAANAANLAAANAAKVTDGQSAYQLAVAAGYNGTEAEWLASLKGATGATGSTGDTGPQGIQGEQGEKGDKGDAFTFADFTSEQIVELQKPATDAAVAANSTLNMLSSTLSEEEFVMSASASILCGWWNVASPPQATAEQQYWWDGASMHVSVAVLDTKGVITGYTWNPLALSDTAVYIDSSTSAVYQYKNGVMVSFSNITAVIALQLHGINEVLTKINAEV